MSSNRVPSGLYYQSRFFAATRGLWRRLAEFETRVVGDEIRQRQVDRPVYVAALARSGTTIVTEMLARHPHLTSHRYSDFPNVWTPYWRNYLLQKTRFQVPGKQERAHRDRMLVSNDSPEAVEEVLWRSFFENLQDASVSQVMDAGLSDSGFERFYTEHILKLLAVRNAGRYLAKGNYNISRIRYILALFPDAKFLVPVRDPVRQIASLAKQHTLFNRASEDDPRVPLQMAMSGHFEFGPRRMPVNFGDLQATQAIIECWQQGREVEGWARYWAASYRHILKQVETFPEVRKACLLLRYEDLCTHSAASIDRILAHCELPVDGFEDVRSEYTARLRQPDYYEPDFNADELGEIERHCHAVNENLSRFCQNP